MRLFKGRIEAIGIDAPTVSEVVGFVRRVEEKTEAKSHVFFPGTMICRPVSFSGFFTFRLETDFGFKGTIRVTSVEPHHRGSMFLMRFKSFGVPESLPADGTLGEL